MKNRRFILMLATLLIAVLACKSPKEKALSKIEGIEKVLYADSVRLTNRAKAAELIKAYEDFATAFPEDTLSPHYLFKAGELAMNINQSNRAIDIFSKVMKDYQNYRMAPVCLFLQAFVYENQLNNLDKARSIYNDFIKKYPTHNLTDDAKASIKFLGKSPEELIKEFEAMRDSSRTDSLTSLK